eukprot:gene33515-37877_t
MFGYARDEMEGASGNMLYATDEIRLRVTEQSRPLLLQGQSYKSEVLLRRKDGALFWGRIYGRSLDPSDIGFSPEALRHGFNTDEAFWVYR